jgi:hypothetical protein
MGHVVLPGGLTPYYDVRIEELRKRYSQLIYNLDEDRMIKALEKLKHPSRKQELKKFRELLMNEK